MNNTGILIIHGFAGSREEVRPLYDYFQQQNYRVTMVVLAGHEQTKAALAKTSYEDWITSAAEAYQTLEQQCQKVIVIGFSMGGLVAVNLYQRYRFYKLVTINSPIYYWNVKRILWNLKMDFKFYAKQYFGASTEKPIASLMEFQKILFKTKTLVKGVDCPILIFQTLDDDTVQPRSATWLYENVSGEKSLHWISEGGHAVLCGVGLKAVIAKLSVFIPLEYDSQLSY